MLAVCISDSRLVPVGSVKSEPESGGNAISFRVIGITAVAARLNHCIKRDLLEVFVRQVAAPNAYIPGLVDVMNTNAGIEQGSATNERIWIVVAGGETFATIINLTSNE